KEAEARIGVAAAGVKAQNASQSPRLSLDGNYRYISEVPEVNLGPQELQLGYHHNASIGPTLSYEIYDGGVDSKATASNERNLRAEHKDRDGMRLRMIMDVRLAYARVQMGIEELHQVNESIRVVQAHLKDTQQRLKAGSASRLELLAAQREELQLNLRYSQTQTNLAEGLQHLGTLIGVTRFPEPMVPVGMRLKQASREALNPNIVIDLETMRTSLRRLQTGVAREPNAQHPSLQAWDDRLAAVRLMAESRDHESRPKVQAFAKSTYEYPHGPLDETVWQNAVGVSVSLTLYDGGLRQGLTAQKTAEAQINAMKKSQILRGFQESWNNARSRLDQMHTQANILRDSIHRSQQEADLTAVNYRAGVANYLEVQRSNNQVLEARTALLRLEAQMLVQLATLNYLSAPTEVQP
ncbi:MAG: TolC family protein, partial [Pseudobdellovibrionaceae bacterium]|nr:TolC family protein [Pseudobdellovibrionaceae bacterium]